MIQPRPLVDTHAHLADPRLLARLAEVLDHCAAQPGGPDDRGRDDRRRQPVGGRIAREHPEIWCGRRDPPQRGGGRRRRPTGRRSTAWPPPPSWWRSARPASTATGIEPRSPTSKTCSVVTSTSRHELGLPVIIHSRDCHRDMVEQLSRARAAGPRRRALVHRDLGRGRRVARTRAAHLVRRDADLRQQVARPAPVGRGSGSRRSAARRDRLPLSQPRPAPRPDQRAGAGGAHGGQIGGTSRHRLCKNWPRRQPPTPPRCFAGCELSRS